MIVLLIVLALVVATETVALLACLLVFGRDTVRLRAAQAAAKADARRISSDVWAHADAFGGGQRAR